MLCDTYIFYADVYFLQNFIIKIAVLYLSLYVNKYYFAIGNRKSIVKLISIAAVGTVIEVLGLWLSNSYAVFLMLVHLLELPLMFCLLLGKKKQLILKLIISGYFFVMVINATLEILWNWFGRGGGYIFFLGISCLLTGLGIRVYQEFRHIQKGLLPVEICHENHKACVCGFYDSGNHLKDPYTGKGVHIVSQQLLEKLNLQKGKAVLVPYHSLGNEAGVLEVYYVNEMIIGEESDRRYWQNCPIGVTKENLFKEGKYEIILNEEVF